MHDQINEKLVIARIPRRHKQVGASVQLLLRHHGHNEPTSLKQLVEKVNEWNLSEPQWVYWIVPAPPKKENVHTYNHQQPTLATAQALQKIRPAHLGKYGIWAQERTTKGKGSWAPLNVLHALTKEQDEWQPRFYSNRKEGTAALDELEKAMGGRYRLTLHKVVLPVPAIAQ